MQNRTGDITLELDHLKLVINPSIGASIVALLIKNDANRWAPVLRTAPNDSSNASDAGSFVMAPWTNRIKNARFDDDNSEHLLRSNMDDASAIHGIVRDLPWTISDRSPISARFVFDSRTFEQSTINYPFKFGAVQRFEIGPKAVEIDLSVTNLDDRPIPVGCGHHPYIHRHLFSDADDLRISLDVSGRYPSQGCIPTGDPINDAICNAFRTNAPIGNPGLDDVFAGFEGSAHFEWAMSNIRMQMRCSDNLNHVVIYTPKEPDGSPNEFVCVEPVTMVNDGFNRLDAGHTDTGVTILKPMETLSTRMILAFSSAE